LAWRLGPALRSSPFIVTANFGAASDTWTLTNRSVA
jgi:hypothetical protein